MNIIYPETDNWLRALDAETDNWLRALDAEIVDWLRALDAETDISRYLPIALANWIDAGVHNTRQDT